MTGNRLGVFGILAFVAFVASFLVFTQAAPGYSYAANMVSELGMSSAPYALEWNLVGFGLAGLLVLPLSWGLYGSLRPLSGAAAISVLTMLSGLGWASLGVFPASPHFQASLHTTRHFIAVGVNYLAFLVGALLFFLFLRREPYWRPWAWLSLVAFALGLSSFLVPPSVPRGFAQSVALLVYFLWVLALGVSILRRPPGGELRQRAGAAARPPQAGTD